MGTSPPPILFGVEFINMPQRPMKFILLCHARTGSSLLGSLLASHPQIQWEGEYFKPMKQWRGPKKLVMLHWPWFYLNFRASKCFKSAYGCKMAPHYTAHIKTTIHQLHRQNWLVIYLHRQNIFENVLSMLVAEKTKLYRSYTDEKQGISSPRICLEPDIFLNKMDYISQLNHLEQEAVAHIPHLELTYESDLSNSDQWSQALDQVFGFLNLERIPALTNLKKTWDQPYSEIVTNFPEILQSVRNSSFANFLPSDSMGCASR